MSVIISPSTDLPSIVMPPSAFIVTGGSHVADHSDLKEMFRTMTDYYNERAEPNHTLFIATGWNSIFFRTDVPIVCNNYTIWFSEDFQSGNRATVRMKLFTSMSPLLSSYALQDDVVLARPYYQKYGCNAISVSNTLPGVTSQYFQLWLLANDWGAKTDGPRVNGFQIT